MCSDEHFLLVKKVVFADYADDSDPRCVTEAFAKSCKR